jgi:hypothetical protein
MRHGKLTGNRGRPSDTQDAAPPGYPCRGVAAALTLAHELGDALASDAEKPADRNQGLAGVVGVTDRLPEVGAGALEVALGLLHALAGAKDAALMLGDRRHGGEVRRAGRLSLASAS